MREAIQIIGGLVSLARCGLLALRLWLRELFTP
jgi:hypothetical protein